MATNGQPLQQQQQQTSTSLAGSTGPGYQPNLASGTSSTGGLGGGTGAAHEFMEFGTTTLSWTVNNLKTLFEGSKGDSKSRVVKSCAFGGSRWTVLLYANAGGSANDYCSLYLSCEPAPEEYEDPPGLVPIVPTSSASPTHQSTASGSGSGALGRWTREGTYQFKFVINGPDGKMVCVKEAANHTFASKTANWGWAQFAKRDTVYFNNPVTRQSDYMTVVCSIWSIPKPPTPLETVPKEVVPKSLLHSVGMLLDDQTYSDVEFVIARKGKRKEARIWANRTLLSRAEYFSTMLSSGFAEDFDEHDDGVSLASGSSLHSSVFLPNLEDSDSDSDTHQDSAAPSSAESSDIEDEDEGSHSDLESASSTPSAPHGTSDHGGGPGEGVDAAEEPLAPTSSAPGSGGTTPRGTSGFGAADKVGEELVEREVQGEVSRPSEAGAVVGGQRRASSAAADKERKGEAARRKQERIGPRKTRIVVKDASYPTFFALLYYLYTDHIVFSPLTSSFVNGSASSSPRRARETYLVHWMRNHPGRPRPASAKSVYVLADKMGLVDLKARAFAHIVAGLNVANIPYEAFSAFSAAFDEVRKVEVDFFLKNWNEIKRTEGMRDIWSHIRTGRHRGFEEVWPLIISQLEFVALGGVGGESAATPVLQ